VALEVRVEEAEGQLAAAQAELETILGERDSKLQQLSNEHSEALASAEASYKAEVRTTRRRSHRATKGKNFKNNPAK
jgi:hypothetical protein